MTNCPKCDRPMAKVMKREGDQVHTYQECEHCDRPPDSTGDEEARGRADEGD